MKLIKLFLLLAIWSVATGFISGLIFSALGLPEQESKIAGAVTIGVATAPIIFYLIIRQEPKQED